MRKRASESGKQQKRSTLISRNVARKADQVGERRADGGGIITLTVRGSLAVVERAAAAAGHGGVRGAVVREPLVLAGLVHVRVARVVARVARAPSVRVVLVEVLAGLVEREALHAQVELLVPARAVRRCTTRNQFLARTSRSTSTPHSTSTDSVYGLRTRLRRSIGPHRGVTRHRQHTSSRTRLWSACSAHQRGPALGRSCDDERASRPSSLGRGDTSRAANRRGAGPIDLPELEARNEAGSPTLSAFGLERRCWLLTRTGPAGCWSPGGRTRGRAGGRRSLAAASSLACFSTTYV